MTMHFNSFFCHIFGKRMINSEKSNNAGVAANISESPTEIEQISEIKQILAQQSRRAKCGAVIRIDAMELMDEESTCKLRTPYIYGILSNIEDACELTNSRAFQINFASDHINFGNNILATVAPYFEHTFEVVKFEEEEDDQEDSEFTKLFEKENGMWKIVECELCEFCETCSCDRALFRDELEIALTEEKMIEHKRSNENRFAMYRKFIWMKHGHTGKVRHEIDDCVEELILLTFPVEAGKRKRGFKPLQDNVY